MGTDSTPVERADDDLLVALRSIFGAVGVVAGAFLVYFFLGSVVVVLSGAESQAALESRTAVYAVYTATASAGFGLAALGYVALRDEWDLLHVRPVTRRDLAYVVGGLVALAAVNLAATSLVTAVLSLVESVFGTSVEFGTNSVVETGRENPVYFLYMIPVSLLIVGPGEELLFRGVVQGLFRRVAGVVPAVVLASCLFGLVHLPAVSSGSAWPYVFATVALALVLGALYEYTESILVPAVIHGCWNVAIYVNQWLDATGVTLLP